MITILVLLGVVASLLLSFFYSGIETAVYRASEIRLKTLEKSGDDAARRCLGMLAAMPAPITAILIGNNIANYAGTYLLTSHLGHLKVPESEFIATVVLTPLFFVFSETLPKRLGHLSPVPYLLAGIRVLELSRTAYRPISATLGLVTKVLAHILRRLGHVAEPTTGRERLLEYFEASVAEEVLTSRQHEMVGRILEIQAQTVRDVMLPIASAFTLPEDLVCREAARRMNSAGQLRAPLVDRSGQPTGRLVVLNDILRRESCLDQPVTSLATPMVRLHANTRMDRALRRLGAEEERLALATGKGDAVVGVVSAADLAGAIVGAIRR